MQLVPSRMPRRGAARSELGPAEAIPDHTWPRMTTHLQLCNNPFAILIGRYFPGLRLMVDLETRFFSMSEA